MTSNQLLKNMIQKNIEMGGSHGPWGAGGVANFFIHVKAID